MARSSVYFYRALDQTSKKNLTGTVKATSIAQVAARLKAQGLIPLTIKPQSETGLNQEIDIPWLRKPVRLDDLAVFTRQLAGLISAGVPLLRSIGIVVEQTEKKSLREALTQVQQDIESGTAFSVALQRHPRVFPALLINVVKVGETGGFLAASLESLADTYKRESLLRNKIKAAVTYPAVVLTIALLGMIAMVWFIVPVFKEMFEGLGTELPALTQGLINLSDSMIWLGPLLIVVITALALLWRKYRRNRELRRIIDPIQLRLPVFGSLLTRVQVTRFARNLAMMLGAGVPLTQALFVLVETSTNEVVRAATLRILDSVKEGGSLSAPIAEASVFPVALSHMVAVGEESGSLPAMLASVADITESEVNAEADQLAATLEPVLLVVVGTLIGGMVLALYLPIFGLYGDIAGLG